MKQMFNINGMSCSACSDHIEKNIGDLKGVNHVNVNLLGNTMTVDYNSDELDESKIVQVVSDSGYHAVKSTCEKQRKPTLKENLSYEGNLNESQELLYLERRLFLSFLFILPIFYLSIGPMISWPLPAIFYGTENAISFAFTQFLFLLPIVYVNRKYYKVGFKALIKGSPNVESLVSIGSLAAILYGIFAIYKIGYGLGKGNHVIVVSYAIDLYFESAALILTLHTLGNYLEKRLKGKSSETISKLIDLAPKTVTVLRDALEKEIPLDEVKKKDVVVVKSGQRIPVDGKIIDGGGFIDESALTGNMVSVYKKEGDKVLAATINKKGTITLQAEKVGEDTALWKIIKLVEEASSSKGPYTKLTNKVTHIFVPIAIGISGFTAMLWIVLGYKIEFAILMGLAVLIISCPASLGLATPLPILAATRLGVEHGILIKTAESLELSYQIDTVVLDKTGTVTEGKPVVTDIVLLPSIREDYFLMLAASLEMASEHPLGQAIVEEAQKRNLKLKNLEEFTSVGGRGVEAKIEGKVYFAGNAQFMEDHLISRSGFMQKSNRLSEMGRTPIFVAEEDQILGMIAVSDRIRSTSKEAIHRLQTMEIEVIMLSGDNQITTEAIAKQVGIQKSISNVLPQDKENEIKKLQELGKRVAMVGDGINDAPALIRADIGIAIGAATEIAIESADVVLLKNSLLDVVSEIQLSRAVSRNIKQNIFWAFFYNLIAIPLAAGAFYLTFGWTLNPMLVAATMSLSLVFIIGNTLRLKLYQSEVFIRIEENPMIDEIITEECDDRNFETELDGRKDQLKKNLTIRINGMMCSHCSERVERVLNSIEGITARVNLDEKLADIELSKNVEIQTITNAVTAAGYDVISIEE